MDRFVIRTPTWKTLDYASMAAQSFTLRSSISQSKSNSNNKCLQPKQLNEIPQPYDIRKRRDGLFYSNQENTENLNGNSNDSGLSSASSLSPHQIDDDNVVGDVVSPHKKLFAPKKNKLETLTDYIDCPVEKENNTYMTITRTPKSHQKAAKFSLNFEKVVEVNSNSERAQVTPAIRPLQNPNRVIMARIQRDLNSPSAAARIKALKALKSPSKSAYSHFDIPEAEQSLHIPEPPSLQEIMRNIVVYVEVRSGEDNRSAGVRKVIEALGARVNLSLLRDTTHVIFKDGLLSTFKKATQMGIPVVSILWIEACKNERRICDPKDYPISNLDRYENPELYNKIKRVKSMQPDSECNKRIRTKAGVTPKDSTPTQKTGAQKKTNILIGDGTPVSSTNKKKTDISQFFKKLEKSTPNSISKVGEGNGNITLESPATQLLNRISSENYTPLEQLKKVSTRREHNNVEVYNNVNRKGPTLVEDLNLLKHKNSAKKTLDYLQADTTADVITKNVESNNSINSSEEKNAKTKHRRSSVILQAQTTVETDTRLQLFPSPMKITRLDDMPVNEIETATDFMSSMAISVTSNKASRRRSSIHTPKDMSITAENSIKVNNIKPILEETNDVGSKTETVEIPTETEKLPITVSKRGTLYDITTMNQTDLLEVGTSKTIKTPVTKSTHRHTINASKTIKKFNKSNNSTNVTTRRRTCYSIKSVEQTTEISETIDTPAEKRVISNKIYDIVNEDELKTPPATSKRNKPTYRRRTLYAIGTRNLNDTDNATCSSVSPSVTPTNFQKGHIASSTLLDDNDYGSKSVLTPPANTTIGKLVEETEECATPLMFSSTRTPGNKRRTLFDVSMDIITQRLQCINQSARRSLVPPTPSTEVTKTIEKATNTPENVKKSNNLQNASTQQALSSTETLAENNVAESVATIAVTPEPITVKKKRKLFIPNELLTPPPLALATTMTTTSSLMNSNTKKLTIESNKLSTPVNNVSSVNSVTKRRRTLMPISQPQLTTVTQLKSSTSNANNTPRVRTRRSTLDFEQIQNIKTKTTNASNDNDTSSSSSISSTNANKETNTQMVTAKKMPILVYTNMHHQQIDVICEAIDKLGIFSLESCVTDTTTHLVSLEPRRTLNILRAITRGLWILEYTWILDSLNAGKWLPEETYELKNFSKSIEMCRSERQAFGVNYKCELFRQLGTFYISSQCYPLTKENLQELIILCCGRVVHNRKKARYIIGDANGNLEDKIYLTPYWILDSITQMQLMKVNKYMCSLSTGK